MMWVNVWIDLNGYKNSDKKMGINWPLREKEKDFHSGNPDPGMGYSLWHPPLASLRFLNFNH